MNDSPSSEKYTFWPHTEDVTEFWLRKLSVENIEIFVIEYWLLKYDLIIEIQWALVEPFGPWWQAPEPQCAMWTNGYSEAEYALVDINETKWNPRTP